VISLDLDMGGLDPEVLRKVAQPHKAFSGVYCAVLAEGVIVKGDPVGPSTGRHS
jgi:MOSC domain-containing protein YiiM